MRPLHDLSIVERLIAEMPARDIYYNIVKTAFKIPTVPKKRRRFARSWTYNFRKQARVDVAYSSYDIIAVDGPDYLHPATAKCVCSDHSVSLKFASGWPPQRLSPAHLPM